MNLHKNQKGAGLIEVLVALLLLAVSVLGFTALQLQAVEATSEGTARIQAMGLARDLSERIRSNRDHKDSFKEYQDQIQTASKQKDATKNCYQVACTELELADFDVSEVKKNADSAGMTFNLIKCPGSNLRHCIYVAWNETSATDGSDDTACTNGNAYRTSSQCLILETF